MNEPTCEWCNGEGYIIEIEDPENGVMDEYFIICPLCGVDENE